MSAGQALIRRGFSRYYIPNTMKIFLTEASELCQILKYLSRSNFKTFFQQKKKKRSLLNIYILSINVYLKALLFQVIYIVGNKIFFSATILLLTSNKSHKYSSYITYCPLTTTGSLSINTKHCFLYLYIDSRYSFSESSYKILTERICLTGTFETWSITHDGK